MCILVRFQGIRHGLVLSLLAAWLSMVAALANAEQLPFRLANRGELAALKTPKVVATPLSQTEFRTAAYVTVKTLPNKSASDVKRTDKTLAAVYKAVLSAGEDPNPHTVPPPPQPGDFLDYEENHDSVQAWATMSENGVPFVMMHVEGQSSGVAASSWSTHYVIPGTGQREVYAQFKVPEVHFEGRHKDSAPSLSWARMRVDFLVSGYPAWSTETLRFNTLDGNKQKAVYMETFGHSLGLTPDHTTSAPKTITLKLGTYPAGHTFDLTLLFQIEGRLDSSCQPDMGETACSAVSARINWDSSAPPPTFYAKPAP